MATLAAATVSVPLSGIAFVNGENGMKLSGGQFPSPYRG